MTGAQYQEIRDRLGMSREKLASALGITSSTVFRRENSDAVLPEAEAAILRLAESREAETAETSE